MTRVLNTDGSVDAPAAGTRPTAMATPGKSGRRKDRERN